MSPGSYGPCISELEFWSSVLKAVEGSDYRGSLSFARPENHVACDSRSESRIEGVFRPKQLRMTRVVWAYYGSLAKVAYI